MGCASVILKCSWSGIAADVHDVRIINIFWILALELKIIFNCKTRRVAFKFGDWVRLILKILRYIVTFVWDMRSIVIALHLSISFYVCV